MKKILLIAMLAVSSLIVYGQGSTTSAINGRITDENGEPLIGATVLAVYTATGAEYGNITDVDGYFRIPNMKAGGPYQITVTYVGFETKTQDGIYLDLGQSFK